jgi:hypothetical protein
MSTPERTCYGVARSCQTLFKSYVAMPLICNHDIAAEQQARFNIWAANIGVFADLRSSLDYCLKENNEVRMMVLQLLDLIHRNLRRGMFGFSSLPWKCPHLYKGNVKFDLRV